MANPESDDDGMDSLASQQYETTLLHDVEHGSSCDDMDALLLEASQKYEAGLKHDVGLSDAEECDNGHEVKTSNEEVIAIDDKPSQQLKITRFACQLQMSS